MTEPCIIVIFGSTGNLSTAIPLAALYQPEAVGRLHRPTGGSTATTDPGVTVSAKSEL